MEGYNSQSESVQSDFVMVPGQLRFQAGFLIVPGRLSKLWFGPVMVQLAYIADPARNHSCI